LHAHLFTNYNLLTCCHSYYRYRIRYHTRLTLGRIRCHPGRLGTKCSYLSQAILSLKTFKSVALGTLPSLLQLVIQNFYYCLT
jgi:hypothetical protein